MGIGKKLSDQIKVVSVHCEDAVDWDRTEGGKIAYSETREFERLAFKDGKEPSVFTIAALPPAIVARCREYKPPFDALMAFCFGVVECSDRSLGLQWDHGGDRPRIKMDSLESLPDIVIREIGGIVLERQDLSVGESPRFALSR